MKLCQADEDGIRPIGPRIDRKWFSDGQCVRLAIDILREAAKPLTVLEIATEIMTRRGMPVDDRTAVKAACTNVRNGLNHHEGRDVVTCGGYPKRWRVAD